MFLYDRLRTLDLVLEDEVKTYSATDPETGHVYLLHWMPSVGTPEWSQLDTALGSLSDAQRTQIAERGVREGKPYLITENLPGFTGLGNWLQASARTQPGQKPLEKRGAWRVPSELLPKSQSAGEASPSRPAGLGEFTMMMRGDTPAPPPAESKPPSEFTKVMRTQPPSPGKKSDSQPGEFTMMMRGAPNQPPPAPPRPEPPAQPTAEITMMMRGDFNPEAAPAPPPSPPQMANPSAQSVGEFTQMMRGVQNLPAPPPAQARQQQPGEFTQMLRGVPAQSPPTPAARPPQPQAGEFTNFINGLEPQTPSRPKPEGDFTRLIKGAVPGPVAKAEPTPFSAPVHPVSSEATGLLRAQPPTARGAMPVASGPGEYTRMFASPAVGPTGASEPTPAPPASKESRPAPAKKTDPTLIVVFGVLGFLAICAIVLILYFALKK